MKLWLLASLLAFVACTWVALKQLGAPVGINWSSQPSFWRPLERNAFLRLPRTGPARAATFTPDGRRGWAVAGLDTLLGTDDGGNTWSVLARGVGATTLVFSDDGRRGWGLGPAYLRRTDDGGRRWTDVADPVLKSALWLSLAFDATGQTGILVGAGGACAITRDGGQHWRTPDWDVAPGRRKPDALLAAAWSADGVNAWVVGGGATVRLTHDGGRNWAPGGAGLPPDAVLASVQFAPGGLHGWVVSNRGQLFTSDDGGYRWRRVDDSGDTRFADVRFRGDGKTGWAVTQDHAVLATVDGGAHWQPRGRPFDRAIRGLFVPADGALLWLAGDQGIMASGDGGLHWQARSRDALGAVAALAFDGAGRRGWAVGEHGTLLHSADGGGTWAFQTSATEQPLYALAVLRDGQRVWIAGGAGILSSTTDGGKHWTRTTIAGNEDVIRMAFSQDGQRGVLLGRQGTIWLSGDGGRNWRLPRHGIGKVDAADLSARADGATMLVSTRDGDLFHSIDAGETWQEGKAPDFPSAEDEIKLAKTKVSWFSPGVPEAVQYRRNGDLIQWSNDGKLAWIQSGLFSGCAIQMKDASGISWRRLQISSLLPQPCVRLAVWFQENSRSGWVAAGGARWIATTDGGAHWRDTFTPYRRLPGPWYWCALLVITSCMVLALRRSRPAASQDSAAGLFVDDDAITAFEDDRLAFAPLARGLSRFLRNPRTSPPLTLSITGDWGTGKSSLMQLLCADLRRYGQRPIWFNAWHHQKDEQLFAALLGTIQAQAAPSSWGPAGWIFRLKLLWVRSKRHFAFSFLLLMLVASLFAFPFQHSIAELGDVLAAGAALTAWFGTEKNAAAPSLGLQHVGVLAQLLALLTAARLLYKGMQAFGVNPALMFKGLSEQTSLKQASAQNSFRATFARQFEEVAGALPYRMTIVVDDLDRCRPENILEVLETVNFLTSSGRCFVVFGMARERVIAALGMAFEKIADELGDLGPRTTDPGQNDAATIAKARRRAYASDYLEKLVNLEIKVPERGDIGADALLDGGAGPRAAALAAAGRNIAGAWPLWLAAVAIGAGIAAGTMVSLPVPDPAPQVRAQPPSGAAATSQPVSTTAANAPAPRFAVDALRSLLPAFEAGQASPAGMTYGPSVLAGVLLLAMLAIHALMRLRAQAVEVHDSQAFKNGLKVWTALAASRRDTPRAIKRWGNRLRYFAMLQQGGALEETRGQRLGRLVAARFGRRPAPSESAPGGRHMVIKEGRLVAIGAAHEAYGDQWLEKLNGAATLPDNDLLTTVLRRHMEVTREPWQRVSQDEALAFGRLLAGVKLPSGDAEAGAPPHPERPAPPNRPNVPSTPDRVSSGEG